MTESDSSSTDRPTVIVRVFGLLLGQDHSVVMVRPLGRLYKDVFCIVKG